MSDPEISALYRVAPEGFIEARDALAKRLREDGRGDDASTVKKLRRPTVAAWALDQLAEDVPDAIGELLAAGADLAGAQRATLSGRDPSALRDATARRREPMAGLTQIGGGRAAGRGTLPDPHVEDIRGTLEAASVDDEVGERLRAGTLEQTFRPSAGFGECRGLQLASRRDEVPRRRGPSGAAPRGCARSTRTTRSERARSRPRSVGSSRSRRLGTEVVGRRRRARARMAEQVSSMQCRLDAAREARDGGVHGVRSCGLAEAGHQGIRRRGAQARAGRRLALDGDAGHPRARGRGAPPPRTCRTGALRRRSSAAGTTRSVLRVSKSFSPVSGILRRHDAPRHLPVDAQQRLADAKAPSGPRVLLVGGTCHPARTSCGTGRRRVLRSGRRARPARRPKRSRPGSGGRRRSRRPAGRTWPAGSVSRRTRTTPRSTAGDDVGAHRPAVEIGDQAVAERGGVAVGDAAVREGERQPFVRDVVAGPDGLQRTIGRRRTGRPSWSSTR